MNIYMDTSAFLAILNAVDEFHRQAAVVWDNLLNENVRLTTNSFVLVETHALVQKRLGLEAVRILTKDIIPLFEVTWIDEELYQQSITSYLSANRRQLSLVDCTSFVTMLKLNVTKVFTFDPHFEEQGFEILRPDFQ